MISEPPPSFFRPPLPRCQFCYQQQYKYKEYILSVVALFNINHHQQVQFRLVQTEPNLTRKPPPALLDSNTIYCNHNAPQLHSCSQLADQPFKTNLI